MMVHHSNRPKKILLILDTRNLGCKLSDKIETTFTVNMNRETINLSFQFLYLIETSLNGYTDPFFLN
jgi:hypothetical protein